MRGGCGAHAGQGEEIGSHSWQEQRCLSHSFPGSSPLAFSLFFVLGSSVDCTMLRILKISKDKDMLAESQCPASALGVLWIRDGYPRPASPRSYWSLLSSCPPTTWHCTIQYSESLYWRSPPAPKNLYNRVLGPLKHL